MYKFKVYQYTIAASIFLAAISCKAPAEVLSASKPVPESFGYAKTQDTANISAISWNTFFKDKNLTDLIDVALKNNQELNITLQEIEIAKNDIRIRKGAYCQLLGYVPERELRK